MRKTIIGGYKVGELIGKKIFDFIPEHFLSENSSIEKLKQDSSFKKWVDYLKKENVPHIITKEKSYKRSMTSSERGIKYDKYKLWKELVISYQGTQKNVFIFKGTFEGRD